MKLASWAFPGFLDLDWVCLVAIKPRLQGENTIHAILAAHNPSQRETFAR